jgi:hypothetical protein
MNFIKSNRDKCFYSSQKVAVLALNSRLTVGKPILDAAFNPAKEQCARGVPKNHYGSEDSSA